MNELDGVVAENVGDEGGILVIVTCLSLNSLDDALVRPGRLHYHIHLDYPSPEDVQRIVELKLRRIPVSEGVSAAAVAACLQPAASSSSSKAITGADINGFCRRAVEHALRDNIATLSQQQQHHGAAIDDSHSGPAVNDSVFHHITQHSYPESIHAIKSVSLENFRAASRS